MNKLLFLLLLLPTSIHAQNNFKVDVVSRCKCYSFTYEIKAISFDNTVTAKIHIKDSFCPAEGDSIYYNGKVWRWHKKQFHLDGNIEWGTVKPEIQETNSLHMKAYSPAGNSLVSDDSTHFKVYYIKTDTLKNNQ